MALPLVWLWVMVIVLGNDGGLVSSYNGGSVVGCACVMGCYLICGAGLVVLWVVV